MSKHAPQVNTRPWLAVTYMFRGTVQLEGWRLLWIVQTEGGLLHVLQFRLVG